MSSSMTDAEFKIVRECLGLTGDHLAKLLGVKPRTVRRWEQGQHPIPDGVVAAIEDLEAQTSAAVRDLVTKLADMQPPTAVVYRTDADYLAAHPGSRWSASWHRAVVARARELARAAVIYDEDLGDVSR